MRCHSHEPPSPSESSHSSDEQALRELGTCFGEHKGDEAAGGETDDVARLTAGIALQEGRYE